MKDRLQMFLKTSAIEYDDRVRKEAKCLAREFDIYLSVVENKNQMKEGICWEKVSFRAHKLKTRFLQIGRAHV